VLWNNAGLGANRVGADERSPQGFPIIMAVHCIGTLRFTLLLLPLLRAAASAPGAVEGRTRVIWTGSGTADYAIANGVDPSKFETGLGKRFANYASSKAAVRMLGYDFARRHPAAETGVVSIITDPGNVKGGAWDNVPCMPLVDALWTKPTVYGAITHLYSGLAPEFGPDSSGVFVQPFGRIEPDDKAYRQDTIKAMRPVEEGGLGYAARLWDWCEEKAQPYV
jgi:NAD(P)-dependent dehydrogenase (short-subunit alcohol dehydrogenase family)